MALAYLRMDNMLAMFKQLAELELYLCPNMNVYKNLLATGFDQPLFKDGFIPKALILEELLFMVMNGRTPSNLTEEETKGRRPSAEILKTRLIKMDKLSSTDAGHFSEAVEEVNRPHIIIRKIEVDRNSYQEFESDADTPLSGKGGLSSQRSLAQSRGSMSRGSIISKEPAKPDFKKTDSQAGCRSPKKLAKSVLYTNSSVVGAKPDKLLESFVSGRDAGADFPRDPEGYLRLHDGPVQAGEREYRRPLLLRPDLPLCQEVRALPPSAGAHPVALRAQLLVQKGDVDRLLQNEI